MLLTCSAARPLTVRALALAMAWISFVHPLSAQQRAVRTADLVGRAAAVKRYLATVGHWSTSQGDGTFYLQFRANGSYTYTHLDPSKVIRAQQAGHYDVRATNLADERWPGVVAPDADARKNRGFELRLEPASIEVASSDPQGLPADQLGAYRLTIALAGDAAAPSFTMLADTLPPDSAFGRLTFTPGP